MKTITKTVYLRAMPDCFEDGGYEYGIASYESPDYTTVAEMEVSMDVPEDFDINAARIDTLKELKKVVQAEAYLKAENIEGQIQSLLAIEDKSHVHGQLLAANSKRPAQIGGLESLITVITKRHS